MTRSEVRIGNWVRCRNKQTGHTEDIQVNLICLIAWNESNLYRYEPIKMNEEWAKHFGVDFPYQDKKYVHEVQNLHFALTGQEL